MREFCVVKKMIINRNGNGDEGDGETYEAERNEREEGTKHPVSIFDV